MRQQLLDAAQNIGVSWTPSDARERGLCLFVPGGASPVQRARESHQDVVSVGVFDIAGDGAPTLLRTAHVPLRIRTDKLVLQRLRVFAERALVQGAADRESGVSVAPTPLEYPRAAADGAPLERARSARVALQSQLAYARRSVTPYASFDRWRIGVARCEIAHFLDAGARPHVDWLRFDDPYVYAADPFAVPRAALGESGEGIRVFFEYFDYRNPVGDIRSVTWSAESGFGLPRAELSATHHLSYPALLEVDGRVLLLPESAEAGCLTAYERVAGVWEPTHPMLSGFRAVDANVVAYAGRWWLFTTDGESEPAHALHVFSSDSPLGPWAPHPANPVVCDPRWGRGAGTPFVHDGRLYRPTQDGAQTYGGAVVLTEITALTMTRYAQRPVARINAGQIGGGKGLHTLSACGPYTVIDAKDRALLPQASMRALRPLLGGT